MRHLPMLCQPSKGQAQATQNVLRAEFWAFYGIHLRKKRGCSVNKVRAHQCGWDAIEFEKFASGRKTAFEGVWVKGSEARRTFLQVLRIWKGTCTRIPTPPSIHKEAYAYVYDPENCFLRFSCRPAGSGGIREPFGGPAARREARRAIATTGG
jgi:hypothetical protein